MTVFSAMTILSFAIYGSAKAGSDLGKLIGKSIKRNFVDSRIISVKKYGDIK